MPPFRENLPGDCPPSDACPTRDMTVLRLVSCDPPPPEAFDSQAKLGMKMNSAVGPCRHASCSLFLAGEEWLLQRQVRKLPRVRGGQMKFVAVLQLSAEAGVMKVAPSGHVDLWMSNDFDPFAAITDVVQVQQ